MSKSKRKHLIGISLLGLTGLLLNGDSPDKNIQLRLKKSLNQTHFHSEQEFQKPEYTLISSRDASFLGFEIAFMEYSIKTDFWENLPRGLSEQEFYEFMKEAPYQSALLVKYEGPANNRHLEFLLGFMMNGFIKNANPKTDKELTFTKEDKEKVLSIMKREMKVGIETHGSFGTVYEYPSKSRIFLREGEIPEIEIWINSNRDPEKEPLYRKKQISPMKTKEDIEVFKKFGKCDLLKESLFLGGKKALDVFYEVYLNR